MAKEISTGAMEDGSPQTDVPCPIVGIGASAGGIEALKTFFPAIKPDWGIAFVVILHLDPDHKSYLSELLGRIAPLPVVLIEQDTPVAANHIYVIPPNAALTIEDGRLHLTAPEEPRGSRMPIDTFFTSLAKDQAECAVCVVLSGTGSDGTLGLRAVKENGGLTLAQAGAEYDGMMRSALSTGLVDFVLPTEQIPAKLFEHFHHLHEVGSKKGPDGVRHGVADYLVPLCAELRARTGHDFTGYKDKTLIRRVQRRMQVLQIGEVPAFIDRLRQDPREIDLLFQDLLIGVTNFFRDPPLFETLEKEVIPRLFEGRGPDSTIRVWVPGCATGEEAYSIAILLREQVAKTHDAPKLQVFASDIDEHALGAARLGRYPATITSDLSAKRLERFFVREDGTYRVVGELREICLFSPHNVLRDVPFSKLDLISCRNLLIYLNQEMQSKLIPLFHYALNDNGYLVLGSSENVTRHSRLFAVSNKANHVFRRRPRSEQRLPELPLATPVVPRHRSAAAMRSTDAGHSLREAAERQLLERYAPAYAVINAEGEVLHTSARTGKYLELPDGPPNNNIFNMARSGLRLDLRVALHKAITSGQVARQNNITIGTNGGRQNIDLIVQPMRQQDDGDAQYMIIFQDIGEIEPSLELPDTIIDAEGTTVRQLEAELRATKEHLQTATEELESSNEELKSGNEELSSINEELQSSNEELETSKEELQSINEELQTVNTDLKARVDELSRVNSDIANLLESTQIATIFLDRHLAVTGFTPAAKDVFRLVESDTGRPISHVRSRLRLDVLEEDAERVLRTLGTIEKQVESSDRDTRYMMRMLPYRATDNVIAGVVITFIDITRITAAEARIEELTHDLRERMESLASVLDLVPVGIFITLDPQGEEIQVNRHGSQLVGDGEERKGPRQLRASYRLLENDTDLPAIDQPLQRAARTGEAIPSFEGRLVRADGSAVSVMVSATPLFDESGKPRGGIAAIVDMSQQKNAQAAQQRLLHELQHRVKNILVTVTSLADRMLKSKPAVEEFSTAFLSRLSAMGALHELLSVGHWDGADVRSVVAAAVAPHLNAEKSNVVMNGPQILLGPNTAASFGMVLHELATNAAKYGALSVADGNITVSWSETTPGRGDQPIEGRRLSFNWIERSSLRVEPPKNEGFGIGFISRSVEYEMDGTVILTFERDGLRAILDIPLNGGDKPFPTKHHGTADGR